MTTQPHLPFSEWRVPQHHAVDLLHANAGDYPEKRYHFYPFKTRFLHAHAIPDGFDLQTIVHHCYCGDGIWRGRDHTVPECYWEICGRCGGTGIYRTKEIVLKRWALNGWLWFHEPTDLTPDQVDTFHDRIRGLVKHSPIDHRRARRAFYRLLLRYEPRRYYHLQKSRLTRWCRDRFQHLHEWTRHQQREAFYHLERLQFHFGLIEHHPDDDDLIPF